MNESSRHEALADVRIAAPEIRKLIQDAERLAILTHARVDADAMASLISMRLAAQALDGACVLSAPGDASIPPSLDFLAGQLEHQNVGEIDAGFDLVIFVDCADRSRAEPLSGTVLDASPGASVINIDHHVTNTRFGDLNLVIPAAAATAEIITVLFAELGIPIDKRTATSLLAGIYGDTLGLKTPSTTPHAMRVSADLVEAGAHLDLIVDQLFREKPFSTVKLWGEAQRRADWHGRLVWTKVDNKMLHEAEALPTETEGLVNFLAGTIGAFAAAVVQEASDGWRVSLRSTTEGVDVSEIAKQFGGGGHPRAAGCRLAPGNEALNRFLDTVKTTLDQLPDQANIRTSGDAD